jgi:hypothetical protein
MTLPESSFFPKFGQLVARLRQKDEQLEFEETAAAKQRVVPSQDGPMIRFLGASGLDDLKIP